MDMEKEVLDWIERYVTGQMSDEEKRHFELLLQNDEALQEKVGQQKFFLSLLFEYGENTRLKNQLNKIHDSLPIEEWVDTYKPQHSKIYVLWKRYRVGVAIAASMGVLAVSLTLHQLSQEKIKGQGNQVTALRRKLDKILSTQSNLNVNTRGNSQSFQFGGTAFILDPKGYLLTNFHVLEGSDSIYIENRKGQSYKTSLVYSNKTYDLAILKIEDSSFKMNSKIPYCFTKNKPELGEPVFTLGYPRDEIVLGQGYLSAETGYEGDTLNYQVSIPVNPGNSGGPILDGKGNVLGILSGKQISADGVAYAVRSTCLFDLAKNPGADSLLQTLLNPNRNQKSSLLGLNRQQQIRKIEDYIFMVKAY